MRGVVQFEVLEGYVGRMMERETLDEWEAMLLCFGERWVGEDWGVEVFLRVFYAFEVGLQLIFAL